MNPTNTPRPPAEMINAMSINLILKTIEAMDRQHQNISKQVALLSVENAAMKTKIEDLEDRIKVLEFEVLS